MRRLLHKLSSELWASYAQARAWHDQEGTWPHPEEVARCAHREGADPWPLLVLTRGELPELDDQRRPSGELAPVADATRYCRPLVLAPTADTLTALRLLDSLYCEVVDPWGRRVARRWLEGAAADWERAPLPDVQLAPVRIQAPPLMELADASPR